MQANIKLGRVWGIPIGLHASWFIIFALVTWSLAMGILPSAVPGQPAIVYWLLGALTAGLFFGSVLAHELGHAFLALRNDIPVRGITLFIFGGIAQIEREPRSPGVEFRVAIAGPLVSLGLALIFVGLDLVGGAIPAVAVSTDWLIHINLLLALFNLVPGFPLDGGRVLRAVVWQVTGSQHRATQVATTIGKVVAAGFMLWGGWNLLSGSLFDGLWILLIGWFLYNAAANYSQQIGIRQMLSDVQVGQAMSRGYMLVPGLYPLSRLVEERILGSGQRYFFVGRGTRPEGLVSLSDITAIPRRHWPYLTAKQVMVPVDRLVTVRADDDLIGALETMESARVTQMPVIEDNEIVGMLSRDQVLRFIQLRTELGV